MSRERAPLIAENGFQGNGYSSPRVFGAKGDGVVDDTVAVQATIDFLKSGVLGGGTMVLDGRYRLTAGLQMDSRVSILGVGGGRTLTTESPSLLMDHATAGMFHWSVTEGGRVKSQIANVLLRGLQSNTGNIFDNTAGLAVDLLLDNVALNEDSTTGNLKGSFFKFEGTANNLAMRNCKMNLVGTTANLVLMDAGGAVLRAHNCEFSTPTSYAAKLIRVDDGIATVTGCDFLGGITPGSCSFLDVSSGASINASANSFRSLDSNIMFAYTWSAGARIVAGNNTYDNGVQLTSDTNQGLLALGSKLEMAPYAHFTDATGSPPIPALYDELTYELSNAAPTIALPFMHYQGQKFRLNVRNVSGGSMTPAFGSHVSMATATVNALANNGIGSYLFAVSDANTPSTFQWVLLDAANT